ncbi:ABC transporter substrate-binding protein [Brachybacterium sp. AOP43-C2-M15]|uniref:ABC transporter substrate-binding protein n=1 Tax=Brachybacterium sp. AOP43-C2-M15 TaxID=3457661 RepID=UPI004033CDF3
MLNRRMALSAGLALPALAGLAACGPNAAGGTGGGDDGENGSASLRLAWWGNPTRDADTQEVVEAFEEVDDSISISLEPGEWGGYWDKLATQTAGGDTPDIIQMDEKYIAEYGGRGQLLDLAEAGLDTSEFAEGAVEVGELPDHGLLAINAGLNAVTMLANPAVFEEAGVDLPDDSTWTWDEFIDIATEITENTEDGTWGSSQFGGVQALFQVWVRQMGQDQYKDGGAGFDVDAATSLLEYALRLQDSEASPGASVSVEDGNQSQDQTLFATGKQAMIPAWSNQAVAFDSMIGGGAVLLRPPSMSGSAADAQLWYKASMYWSISATTADPEAALKVVDFLVNSPEAGKIISVERGVPGNLAVREAITPDLDESNLLAVDYLEAIEDELGEAPEITPQGGGEFESILQRASEDVLFGNITAEEGAQRLVDELEAALS